MLGDLKERATEMSEIAKKEFTERVGDPDELMAKAKDSTRLSGKAGFIIDDGVALFDDFVMTGPEVKDGGHWNPKAHAQPVEPKDKLAEWCKPGKTVAFLGSSGVGKSTLTNALGGGLEIETQAIREADARGRHTTTTRQLHIMEAGFTVLDTPGMRELQLTDVASGLSDVFADLQELSTQCRFRDCAHALALWCCHVAGRLFLAQRGLVCFP